MAAQGNSYIAPAHLGVSPFFGQSLLLIPILCFWILYPNWGATLYGEVRGAGDFRGVLRGMMAGLWGTFAIAIVFLFLLEKTFGWQFFNAANMNYWGRCTDQRRPRQSRSGRSRRCWPRSSSPPRRCG